MNREEKVKRLIKFLSEKGLKEDELKSIASELLCDERKPIPENLEDIINFLSTDDKITLLSKIIEFEKIKEKEGFLNSNYSGWKLKEIGLSYSSIRKFIEYGIIYCCWSSSSRTEYKLVSRTLSHFLLEEAIKLKKQIEQNTDKKLQSELQKPDIETVLEEEVLGHDQIKKIITLWFKSPHRTHILLIGPKGCGKSVILQCVKRCAKNPLWVDGPTVTSRGLSNLLKEKRDIDVLIIDEIEKVYKSGENLDVLLRIMEEGRFSIIKGKNPEPEEYICNAKVIAAGNSIQGFSEEFLDRFYVIFMKEYDNNEYVEIVTRYLIKHYNLSEENARYIASECLKLGKSFRLPRHIAHLSGNDRELIEFLIEQQKKSKELEERYKRSTKIS